MSRPISMDTYLKYLPGRQARTWRQTVEIHQSVWVRNRRADKDRRIRRNSEERRSGKNCKVSSHTFICEGVTIEDSVFIGHSVTFINDIYPRATTADGQLQTESDWVVERTVVKRGASVGSGTTILANVTIGENAIVGAGSMVTKDVPPNSIVAGNPARCCERSTDGAERVGE